MGGFVSKSFGPAWIAALVGAVVSIGTLTVTGTLTGSGATFSGSLTADSLSVHSGVLSASSSPGVTMDDSSMAPGGSQLVLLSNSGQTNTIKWNGNSSIGNAAGDVLDVNGDLSKFGNTDGATYILSNQIDFGYATNGASTGAINYYGYQAGTDQFRNLEIYNGKAGLIATFTGSDQSVTLAGDLTVGSNGAVIVDGAKGIRFGSGTGSRVVSGTGSPEGVISAPVGSLYMRTDGGAGTTLYVKQSGSGNTGWAAK